jgi:choline dehydrogenase-like flavoprotein
VSTACAVNYEGRRFSFHAKRFVLCAGTVESSRLLLCSPAVPNEHDQIGRYFHDHVSLHAAVVPRATRGEVMRRLGPFFVNGVLHTCKLEATEAVRKELGLLAVMAHFTIEEPEDSGMAAVRNLLVSLQRGELKHAFAKNLLPMLAGSREVLALLWATKVRKRRSISKRGVMRMNIDMEQPGSAENRVTLADATDALGMRKARVAWGLSEAEYGTAARFARLIKSKLEALGFAPFAWTEGLLEGARPAMADSYHPMGGLRMGTDPAVSVVSPGLKVHGLENLYVASCAVYPSGGSSNPTFTLIALALWLADQLTAAGS